MKTCPRCNRTYPDSENFCETDSSPLVSAPAFTQQSSSGVVECPVCGGKAEPGEIICNFCGARLDQAQTPAPPPTPSKAPAQPSPYPKLTPTGTPSQSFATARMPAQAEAEQGRSIWGLAGYVMAAVIALAAGAWFAIHLSSGKNEEAAVAPSPAAVASPAAASTSPTVMLANAMPVQVSGPGATSPDRSADAVRKAFDDNRGSLVDTYNSALASDPKVADAMLIRLHVASDGSIASSAVRTSTAPDPSLDEKVVAAMATWKFPTTSAGEIDVDYPIVLAHNPDEEARLESDLQTKVASLSPTESPEYASAPLPEASPIAASSPEGAGAASPGAAASPAVASVPPPEAAPAPEPSVGSEVAKRPHHKHLKVASAPPPSVFDQVQERLKSNPKLRRVKAYTTGGSVTLFGKVFGEGEKSQAEETVRNIPGVTGVIDNIATDEGEWADQQNRIQQQLANSGLDKVTVKVIGHDAFLNGEVKTDLEKTRAVTVAEAAAPVTVRENLIRVTPGNMFGF